MCCLFTSRKTPACIVFFLSFLALIAGVMMIYFSFKLNTSEFMEKIVEFDNVKEFDLDNIRKLIFYSLLIFSLVAIVAAVMGMCACKIKNRCYTVCYGCVLMPTWIIIFVVGIVAVYFSIVGKEVLTDECVKAIDKMNKKIAG